jgi:cold shock protein
VRSSGHVRVWHDGEGWGVIDCPEAPGGCWAHYSAVLIAGYKTLTAGQSVELVLTTPGQDGYAFRAVEVWPAGQTPVRSTPDVFGPSAGYTSTIHITFHPNDSEDAAGAT